MGRWGKKNSQQHPLPAWAKRAPGDRPLRARRRLLILAAGLAAFGLSALLEHFPNLLERLYGESVGPAIVQVLSNVTGLVPFSLAQLLVIGLVLWQLVAAALTLHALLRRRRRLGNALLAGSTRLARDLGVLLLLFYVLWGFHYARAPLVQRLAWPSGEKANADELAGLASQMIDRANADYLEIHGVPDAGVPTHLPENDGGALQSALTGGWRSITAELSLPAASAAGYGPVKTLFAKWLLERLGLQGFYFPFTGEANVRRALPALVRPVAISHEMAHQRGYAPEAEASFLGFMAAAHAAHPHARYSASLFAQRQLLRALLRADPERGQALLARRLPGVQRDVDDYIEYLRRIYGPATRVATRVNDLYLRTNRVEGGVANYGLVTRLLIAYAREKRGRLDTP